MRVYFPLGRGYYIQLRVRGSKSPHEGGKNYEKRMSLKMKNECGKMIFKNRS